MNADKRRSGAIQSAFIRVHQRPIESLYWIAFAALMALVAAVFWRALFTSDTFFFRDISFAHFPRAVELRTLVRSGQLPIWNPFEHFGEPVSVNANYLLFYPTAWLAWMLPAAYGFKLHYLLHFFVLAAGTFLLARRIGLRPFACFLAGALFVFSGPIVSLGAFYNLLPAVAWMPLAVLAADYQMRRGGWKGTGALAGALTLQVFAGEPLTSLATAAMALGPRLVSPVVSERRNPVWNPAGLRGGSAPAPLPCSRVARAPIQTAQQGPQSWNPVRKDRALEKSRYSPHLAQFGPLLESRRCYWLWGEHSQTRDARLWVSGVE